MRFKFKFKCWLKRIPRFSEVVLMLLARGLISLVNQSGPIIRTSVVKCTIYFKHLCAFLYMDMIRTQSKIVTLILHCFFTHSCISFYPDSDNMNCMHSLFFYTASLMRTETYMFHLRFTHYTSWNYASLHK